MLVCFAMWTSALLQQTVGYLYLQLGRCQLASVLAFAIGNRMRPLWSRT